MVLATEHLIKTVSGVIKSEAIVVTSFIQTPL